MEEFTRLPLEIEAGEDLERWLNAAYDTMYGSGSDETIWVKVLKKHKKEIEFGYRFEILSPPGPPGSLRMTLLALPLNTLIGTVQGFVFPATDIVESILSSPDRKVPEATIRTLQALFDQDKQQFSRIEAQWAALQHAYKVHLDWLQERELMREYFTFIHSDVQSMLADLLKERVSAEEWFEGLPGTLTGLSYLDLPPEIREEIKRVWRAQKQEIPEDQLHEMWGKAMILYETIARLTPEYEANKARFEEMERQFTSIVS